MSDYENEYEEFDDQVNDNSIEEIKHNAKIPSEKQEPPLSSDKKPGLKAEEDTYGEEFEDTKVIITIYMYYK